MSRVCRAAVALREGKLQLKRRRRVLGEASYKIASGDVEVVTVKLGRRRTVEAVTWATDASGFKWRSRRTLKILAARSGASSPGAARAYSVR